MKYINPIIKGFHPDPSICRVGEDYYLVTSTFEYFPGIPIYHSRDLVNWKQIGNCIERREQLPLEKAVSSGGIWAPTIRYYNGKFYVTATFDGKGNFIVSSKQPASGWSDAVWTDFSGIDPSMFFEDRKMYYCANDVGERNHTYGLEGISVAEMDVETGKVKGGIKRVWQGEGGGWMEAPHIYHRGGFYYIIAAEGGTGQGHHQIAGRSKTIWGPYENCPENPILTNRNDCSKQVDCSGHGDLIDDVNGNWWMVHLGTRPFEGMSHLGRETFLMPVTWEKDWPVVGKYKKCQLEVDAALWNEQREVLEWSMDFNSEKIEDTCLFRRVPQIKNYIKKNGKLTLKPGAVKLSDPSGSPTFLAVRPLDLECTTEAAFAFCPRKNGDMAGMAVYLNENFYYRIYKKREEGKDYIVFERHIDDIQMVIYQQEIREGTIKIKIVTDGKKYYFYYSLENGAYINVGTASVKFLSTSIAGKCFTGVLTGLFAECDSSTDAEMDVTQFTLTKGRGLMGRPF